MKLKDKELIQYFGQKNVDEALVNERGNRIFLSFSRSPQIDMAEVVAVLQQFPSIDVVEIAVGDNPETINHAINMLPETIAIRLSDLTKKVFERIDIENGSRVKNVFFNPEDKDIEGIPIGEIARKFPDLYSIGYEAQLQEGLNITDLEQINYLLERISTISLCPELMEKYREYLQRNPSEFSSRVIFGSQMIFDRKWLDGFNKNTPNLFMYPGCELKNMTDFSEIKAASENKTILFCVNSMVDISLEVAQRLKEQGISCNIRFESFDNNVSQNAEYTLDEYIAMSQKMEELIGDIDSNLPEEEKFRLIYERILKYLEYDTPAAYPKTKEEEAYSKANRDNCRNLRNALLQGKCVCAGFADVLKNACLLKGIQCEYISGPVDSLESRDAYLLEDKKERERKRVVSSDEKDVIVREYHAWVKVRINGVWYNCDPTWDKDNISNDHVPKYAFLSDEMLVKLGRPTVGRLRHLCTKNIVGQEKSEIFKELEPCSELVIEKKVIEFESTVDENGDPRQFPVVPKVFPWTKMMVNLRKFVNEQKKKTKFLIHDIRKKINPNFDKTAEMEIPVISPSDVEDKTKEIPQVTEEKKAPSWELSEEQLQAVRDVEHNGQNQGQGQEKVIEEQFNGRE